METFANRMVIIIRGKIRRPVEIDYDIDTLYDNHELEKIFYKNCIATANEIIKMSITAIDDCANNKENPIKVELLINRIFIIYFTKESSLMLKNKLTNNVPIEIIKSTLNKYNRINISMLDQLYGVSRKYVYLDSILRKQLKKFGFQYGSTRAIEDIIEKQNFIIAFKMRDFS